MSESGDSGPGRREVAHRLFAAEFDDAEFSYSESDEERAPNYVVTPTGARVNRLFVVGVLTELEQVNEEVLRARIVDPTGPFVVYAGQYQPEALAFLEAATPPLFVAVTGKARTFEPEDGDRVFTSVRPESISEVDAETRDRWVVQATEQTLARVGRMASGKQSELTGETLQQALVDAGVAESDAAGVTLALDYYDTTGDYLQAVRDLSLNAARVVAGDRDEAGTLSRAPGDGTDAPLAALATMELEAQGEAPPTEPSDEPAATDAGTTDTAPDESTTAGSESTASTPTEPESTASTIVESESTASTANAEPSTASESASEPAETAATTETSEEPSEEKSSKPSTETAEPDVSTEPTAQADSAPSEPESVSAEGTADEGSSGTLGDFDSGTTEDAGGTDDEEVGDFDTEFELDEDEREEIEEEYGTDFQSGAEVDDAGEAGIETPDPEELAAAEADAAGEADAPAESSPESGSAAEPAAADEAVDDGSAAVDEAVDAGSAAVDGAATDDGAAAEPPAEDVDLEDAVMSVMTDLNDGSGADREAVITEVMETYGADRGAVEDAVQDALMGGRCYEPDDGKLTPI